MQLCQSLGLSACPPINNPTLIAGARESRTRFLVLELPLPIQVTYFLRLTRVLDLGVIGSYFQFCFIRQDFLQFPVLPLNPRMGTNLKRNRSCIISRHHSMWTTHVLREFKPEVFPSLDLTVLINDVEGLIRVQYHALPISLFKYD